MHTSSTSPGAHSELWRGMPVNAYEVTLSTQSTGNRFIIAKMEMLAGEEPQRHMHEKEDEIFILEEGSIRVYRGDEIFEAHTGDLVWLPRKVPHHYVLLTSRIKATFMATPGHIQSFIDTIVPTVKNDFAPSLKISTEKILAYVSTKMPEYSVYYV